MNGIIVLHRSAAYRLLSDDCLSPFLHRLAIPNGSSGLRRGRALQDHAFPGMDGTLVHPFDDHDFIAGHGSMALEILDDCPDVRCVICAMGGGGMIAGVGSAMSSGDCHQRGGGQTRRSAARQGTFDLLPHGRDQIRGPLARARKNFRPARGVPRRPEVRPRGARAQGVNVTPGS